MRDRWAGIRALKREYKPQPYNRKNKEGIIVEQDERAETAAKYLAEIQWGTSSGSKGRAGEREERSIEYKKKAVIKKVQGKYNVGNLTIDEVRRVVKKLKRHKKITNLTNNKHKHVINEQMQ